MYRGLRRRTGLCLTIFTLIIFLMGCQYVYYINYQETVFYPDEQDLTIRSVQSLRDQNQKDGGFLGKPFKTVHLDLKGAPPKLSYIRKILPILVSSGCDSLLIEYEDMFPYSGKLANLSAGNAYSKQQIKTLLSWAHDLGLEVIPLIQTFGHLEFALKLEEWKHLRELPTFPQEVCPTKDDSLILIKEMLNQVMLMHKGIKFLHIGADEVFHLASCSQCAARSLTSMELYADYVTKVAEYIHETYPGVTPIIWDDMIRNTPRLISETRLPELIEPMIWAYSPNVPQLVSNHAIYWYSKLFKRIWVAGSYKGASKPTTILPNIELRFLNQISWIKFIKNFEIQNVVGFVLTGWSRFDHFAVLCELLPPSIPSLLLNLQLITLACDNQLIDEENLYKIWRYSLSCPENLKFTPFTIKTDYQKIITCNFPGVELYQLMLHFNDLQEKIYNLEYTLTKQQGWMTKFNIKYNYTSPWRIIQDYTNFHVFDATKEVLSFRNYTEFVFNKFFDKHTTKEWMEQNIQPLTNILDSLHEIIDKVINRVVWQRRPIV